MHILRCSISSLLQSLLANQNCYLFIVEDQQQLSFDHTHLGYILHDFKQFGITLQRPIRCIFPYIIRCPWLIIVILTQKIQKNNKSIFPFGNFKLKNFLTIAAAVIWLHLNRYFRFVIDSFQCFDYCLTFNFWIDSLCTNGQQVSVAHSMNRGMKHTACCVGTFDIFSPCKYPHFVAVPSFPS